MGQSGVLQGQPPHQKGVPSEVRHGHACDPEIFGSVVFRLKTGANGGVPGFAM